MEESSVRRRIEMSDAVVWPAGLRPRSKSKRIAASW